MSSAAAFSAAITVALALIGYLATYTNNLRLSQRQERLTRVSRQLSDFYGPLLALSNSNHQVYQELLQRHTRPSGNPPFRDVTPPTEQEKLEWRLWFPTVFAPINRRIYELIVSKADLLIEDDMPEVLLQFCSHAAGYEITLKRWEAGDYSEHLSFIGYPAEIRAYATESFRLLKHE
jgi:hypothetical protein